MLKRKERFFLSWYDKEKSLAKKKSALKSAVMATF
jgi:hypothetical protein